MSLQNDEFPQLKLANQLCFPLYVCSKEIVRKYKPYLDEAGLTYTQYITMMVLWEKEESNVKDLGKLLYLDSGTLTPVLKTLESKGFITRKRAKEDERNLAVKITEEGRRLKEHCAEIPEKMRCNMNISREDAIQLKVLLERFIQSLD